MPSPRDGFYTIGKAIDNSNVVRERDPRTGRDIGWILLLAALVTAGVAFYAWPHLKARQTAGTRLCGHRFLARIVVHVQVGAASPHQRVEDLAQRFHPSRVGQQFLEGRR